MLLAVLCLFSVASLVVNQPISAQLIYVFMRVAFKGENVLFYSRAISQGALGCIEQHPGNFQPNLRLYTLFGDLKEQCEIPNKICK